MRVLLLNSSPHGETSRGFRLAKEMLATLDAQVVERDLTRDPLPPISRDYATAVTSRNSPAGVFDGSERLIREIEETDLLIINTPMHNFTVPAALKLWIDYVLRIGRTFESTPDGKIGLRKDRPVFVLVESGGFHSGERARQPDFLTPYVRYALASIGLQNVNFVLMQGMVFGDAVVAEALSDARGVLSAHAPFNTVAA